MPPSPDIKTKRIVALAAQRLPAPTLEEHILDFLNSQKEGIHFNELFRLLKQKGTVGSYTTLTKALRQILEQGLVKVKVSKSPGLSKKTYYITDKGTARIKNLVIIPEDLFLEMVKAMQKRGYDMGKLDNAMFSDYLMGLIKREEKKLSNSSS